MSQALDLANPGTLQKTSPPAPALSFSDGIRKCIGSSLVGKKADKFVTDLVSLVNQDPNLKACDPISLVAAGMQAQSLDLSLNKSMGQAWVVPFKDNKNKRVLATFQIGYKGYIQLAIRSGQYRKLNVLAIKEGELRSYDPLNEEIDVVLIQDEVEREQATTIGYYAMFEYLNGFRKTMYWSKGKMAVHADKYSPAFSLKATTGERAKVSFADYEAGKFNQRDAWLYSSFWYKDFDGMAYKTMLRQILTKWGIMSVEMQQAYDADMRIINDNEGGTSGLGDIVDADYTTANQGEVIDLQTGEVTEPQPEPKSGKPTKADKNAATTEPESKQIECACDPGTMVRTDVECAKCERKEKDCGYWMPHNN